MNRLSHRALLRVATPTALACATLAAGCEDDSKSGVWYLGPVEAGTVDATTPPDSAPPVTLGKLAQSPCVAPVLEGKDESSIVRQVAAMQSRLIVTSSGGIDAWQIDSQGCPSAKIDAFGDKGHVAIDALSAAPLPGGRALVATGGSTMVIDSVGKTAGTCKAGESEVKARWLATNSEGKALALLVRSPIGALTTDLADPTLCGAQSIELSPVAFVVLAIGYARSGDGVVTAEQDTAYAPIGLARYDAAGTRTSSASWVAADDPGHLCSVAGLVETDQGIVVADSLCRRVVLYDSATLQPAKEAKVEDTPRGVAFIGDAPRVVVPLTRAVAGGAQATFLIVNLQ
ncbi:MAG: hypothetical protein HY898_08980 [Deltaproteobacteria bacterium]|nr:hypothetical protein [Deltaproteobacteria bacterium]